MACRVLEVHAAAAVVVVDLAGVLTVGVGPVPHPALPDPAVDGVELGFRHQERVVLRVDLLLVGRLREIELTPWLSSTARNGPSSFAAGRPNSSVKNVADALRSFAATMVWLKVMAM